MTAAARIESAAEPVRLDRLTVQDFRNLQPAELAFPPAGVVIVGDNGHGKSNLLEAIAYLGVLRSVRNARDRDLVAHGAPLFHMRAAISGGHAREIAIGVERVSGRKKVSLDGVEVPRQVDALGALPSVSWSPGDVALVAGGPTERRRFLDVMLALSSAPYLHSLRTYRGALSRRNAALRDAQRLGRPAAAAWVWEPPLVEHGASLVRARRAWADEQAAAFAELCERIGEPSAAHVRYAGDAAEAPDVEGVLREGLERERVRDAARGVTSVGPHRDDLVITYADRDARTFGSAGQQRTAAIALRLLEARTLRALAHGHPMLLLDDPFAELDRTRTANTLALLDAEAPGQVVLAVPREDDIPGDFARLARWRVQGGVVRG